VVKLKKTKIITTRTGKIQGYIDKEISIFQGIPYAEPPIGDLRLNAPILKIPWEGVLEALYYKPIAPQPPPFTDYFPPPPQDEVECLNLNIWTPSCDNKKRPVMLWIHGGSHIYGSGRLLDGRALPIRGDIVLVSINYRLGPLGFLYLSGIPPNIGQLDQITALTWVRDNIEFFGGDPDNITIFGESAGATSICALMAMPKAKGLFKRAISQSGAVQPHAFDVSVRKTTAEMILKELNLTNDDAEELRRIPVNKIIQALIKAQEKATLNGVELDFRPYIDGEILPLHPVKAIANGYAKDIEFMVGTNLEEWRFWRAFEPNFEQHDSTRFRKRIIKLLKAHGEDENKLEDIIETYKKSRDEINIPTNLPEIYEATMTDTIFRIPSIKCAEAQSKHQKNTYMYLFKWETPFENGRYGSMHALEIGFVFGYFWDDYLFTFSKKTDETEVLSEKMMDAWISFAKTGNPNHPNIPKWSPYDIDRRSTIIFDRNIEIWNDPLHMEREMWYKSNQWTQF
jgi:para-nitrobenzyl esterase